MKPFLYTLILLLSVRVFGITVPLAASIDRSRHATPTITKTISHTEVRRLYTRESLDSRAQKPTAYEFPLTGIIVSFSDPNVEHILTTINTRRDHIPDAEEDKTSDSSANLYSLRIDLASEGYISVYVPNITALTFCESSIAVWLEDSMESELHLAVQGSTKTVSIPVGKGHANSFCSHYLRAEGIGAASDGPAGKEKSLDLGLVSTTRETSSSEGPLVTLTTFSEPALSRKNNSLKAVKLSPSKTSTASSTKIRLSIDESDDEPEAPETVRRKSPHVTNPNSPFAAQEPGLDFCGQMKMGFSDTESIGSNTGTSRGEKTSTSAPHAYAKSRSKPPDFSNLMSTAPIDLSGTERRYDIANEVKGQVISTAAPQETWKHGSFYANGQDYPEEYEPSSLGEKGKHADICEEESFSGSKNEDFGYDTGPTENADESLPAADEADGIPFEDKAAVSTEAGAMAENEEFTANPAPQDSAHDDPLDPSTTTISPHTHATPLPSASQTSRLNIPTLAADISFTFPSPNLAPPPTPTPAPLLPPPLFPLQFEGQPAVPIMWDPACPQISTSTILLPSNEETPVPVTMGMGCWKIVASPTSPGLPNAPSVTTGAGTISDGLQESSAWGLVAEPRMRYTVYIGWMVLGLMVVNFLSEFLALRGGGRHIGRGLVWWGVGRGVVRRWVWDWEGTRG